MARSPDILAWRRYPEPDGTEFRARELETEDRVEALFDSCQILESVIFASGWRLLFQRYGLAGLVRINKRSGWFNEEDDAEAEESLIDEARLAGYDPVGDVFGAQGETTGEFYA